MKMVYKSLTKSGAESNCASSGGQLTVLIEDDKHVKAGQLSAAVYSASSKGLFVLSRYIKRFSEDMGV